MTKINDEAEFNVVMASIKEPLTMEEEIELSKRILAGAEAEKALAGSECLTDEDRSALQCTIEDGEQAYHHLVEANIPRAQKYASRAWKLNSYSLNDREDYLQIALEIICRAAQTFDWRRGCRFSTWAHTKLAQGMLREIDREADIARLLSAMELLPEDQRELLKKRMGFGGCEAKLRELTGSDFGETPGGVQKRQKAAEKNLRKLFENLPLAG